MQNQCRAAYNYSKIAHITDIGYLGLSLSGLLIAVFIPGDDDNVIDDDIVHPDTDLSIVEHLFSKGHPTIKDPIVSGRSNGTWLLVSVSAHWKRPLLVQSKVVEYTENVHDWCTLASKVTNDANDWLTAGLLYGCRQRNSTLKDALEIANHQQTDSSAQAKLLHLATSPYI